MNGRSVESCVSVFHSTVESNMFMFFTFWRVKHCDAVKTLILSVIEGFLLLNVFINEHFMLSSAVNTVSYKMNLLWLKCKFIFVQSNLSLSVQLICLLFRLTGAQNHEMLSDEEEKRGVQERVCWGQRSADFIITAQTPVDVQAGYWSILSVTHTHTHTPAQTRSQRRRSARRFGTGRRSRSPDKPPSGPSPNLT